MTTTKTVPAPTPRIPLIDRATAKRLMAAEFARVLEQWRGLTADEWRLETCNTGWDVRALAAHMVGMAAMSASILEQRRQMRAARGSVGEFIDALTAVQVRKYDGWSPERLMAELDRLAPRAVKGRARTPGFIRRRTMPGEQPVAPPDVYERWTVGYCVDVVLTRDPWMHRSDVAVATGRPMTLTDDHDGVIVDDVVREWAARHGQPCTLSLTGPIARRYAIGARGEIVADGADVGGPAYECDAVEFCRILSGRGTGEGLLRVRVPF